jgi:hypothetical protein
MTGIEYTRAPAPIFSKLGEIKLPDGFSYSLFVLEGFADNCYMLLRYCQKDPFQVSSYITRKSALELIQDSNFKKTEYCREFLAGQPQELG